MLTEKNINNYELPSVYPVTGHTDFVGKGSTFVAIPGVKSNGLDYVVLALQKGAHVIVVQNDVVVPPEIEELIQKHNAKIVRVNNCRKALAEMSAQALDFPAKKLKIVAVTGTKGKTSTSYMAYHMLHVLGKKVALISTVEKRIESNIVSLPLTTPQPDAIHMFLDACVKRNIEYVIMEISAQALSLQRVEGIEFHAGIFTNFSHEHLEFYKDMKQYFEAKTLLISKIKNPKNMFINLDDKHGAFLLTQNPECSSFSLQDKRATLCGCAHQGKTDTLVEVKIGHQIYKVHLPLLGQFNVYNLLGVLCIMHALGINLSDVQWTLKTLHYIPGRMEQYPLHNGARCIIDYAHNPSSFEAVLSTLRSMTSHLIVVFGLAGNRDRQKRPIMASIAQKYCDVVILTSDNPRDENPEEIAKEVVVGFVPDKNFQFHQELNRVTAIELGCKLTKQGSIVAILGKGRDEYQIVGDVTFDFKERLIIKPFILLQDGN
ncbi:MAG TPA: UDP-N-acetylmuramoyl-L-alanyl-D-glutamate--2,6-diaminopimelate ligase [Candidatus Saccharimonadales bacterium]|nr:UDP-N-acetylmuramoyl-L-alanyl-D-glutamate--2,6-diaminopimelate ligase [Candidatus Saccharimonadales bacterium]